MYNIFRILIEVPDYNIVVFFPQKMKRKLSPSEGKNIKGQEKEVLNDISTKYLGTTKASTRMI